MRPKTGIVVALIVACNAVLFTVISYMSRPISAGLYGPAKGFANSPITTENLPAYLTSLEAMKDLPDDTAIQVKFYSAKSGERMWGKSFVIRRWIAEGDTPDADLEVLLDAKYIPELGGGLCPAMQKARANRDMGLNLKKNAATLLWKYRDMLKYKSCFGF